MSAAKQVFARQGYDNPTNREAVDKHQYTPRVRRIGEEKWDEHQQKTYPARRRVGVHPNFAKIPGSDR